MASFTWLGGDLDSALSWSQPDPDNPVLPGEDDTVEIGNTGTLNGSLTVGRATITGTHDLAGTFLSNVGTTVSGGQLTIDAGATFGSSLEAISGAKVIQQGGSNTFGAAGQLSLANGSTYQLKAGTIALDAIVMGSATRDVFEQRGGTVDVKLLSVPQAGTYLLQSGTLNVGSNNEFIGGIAGSTSIFTQNGGQHTVNDDLIVGDTGGPGQFNLNGGHLTTTAEFFGRNAKGTFTQTGGVHKITDRLVLGVDNHDGKGPGHATYTLGGNANSSLTVNTIFIGSDIGCTGTFKYDMKAADAATLTIGGTGGFPGLIVGGEGTGEFDQNGGTLTATVAVGFRSTGTGTLVLTGGSITSSDEKVGVDGNGSFETALEGTTNTVSGSGLTIGVNAGSTGYYFLGRDTEHCKLIANKEVVGDRGVGKFEQYAGLNKVQTLTIGLHATETKFEDFYRLDQAGKVHADTEIIGDNGSGKLYQADGTDNTVDTVLILGKGENSDGRYSLSGTLSAAKEIIGEGAKGSHGATFSQNGSESTNTVSGELHLAENANSNGTYELEKGTLTAGIERIAIGAGSDGLFAQSGGTNHVKTALVIGDGGSGKYDLSGGTLKLGTLDAPADIFIGQKGGQGTLRVSGKGVFDGDNTTIHLGNGPEADGIGHLRASKGAIHVKEIVMIAGSDITATDGSIMVGDPSENGVAGSLNIADGADLTGAGELNCLVVVRSGGELIAKGGKLVAHEAIDGRGVAIIKDHATLELTAACHINVQFAGGAGELDLDKPGTMSGKITHLRAGDVIDLGFKVHDVKLDADTGILSFLNASDAKIELNVAGALSGNIFAESSDGHGGSKLVLEVAPHAPEHDLPHHHDAAALMATAHADLFG